MARTLLFNGKVITPYRIIRNGSLLIEGGKIAGIFQGRPEISDCRAIDAKGLYISPGFIDIHTHGAGGHDFMDGTVEAYIGAAMEHARHGTTALVPTTVASTTESLKETFETYKSKISQYPWSSFLGLHLEGPIFPWSKGAQDPRHIRNPERSITKRS